MKKLITATNENGEIVYGKLIGIYELMVDASGSYYPGWVPDCEVYYWDAMETITGERYAVDVTMEHKFVAHKPKENYRFYEYAGIIAEAEYGVHRRKRGKHCNSSNRKANRKRIKDAMPLPF